MRFLRTLVIAGCGLILVPSCGADPDQPGPGAGSVALQPSGVDALGAAPDAMLSFVREGRVVTFAAGDIEATCATGHRGISARKVGERFGFNVFVARPGSYRCSEPEPFVFFWNESLDLPGSYGISALEPAGACAVNITSLRPRLTGTFAATLARQDGGGPPTIALSDGRFDVPFPSAPDCP